jgi:hypothetical protein
MAAVRARLVRIALTDAARGGEKTEDRPVPLNEESRYAKLESGCGRIDPR